MSNNVSIQVFNQTQDRDLYICVFQKPGEAQSGKIYTDLFPVAWKILPLGPNQTSDPIIYPNQLQLSVTESQDADSAVNRATFQDCNEGETWIFNRPGDFSDVTQSSDPANPDGVVALQNDSFEKIDVGLAKNGTTLVVQKNLAQGEQADFQLTPMLYFLAVSNLQEGDLIRSDQVTQKAFSISLTDLASADVTVSTASSVSGLLEWSVSNEVSSS